MNFDPDTPLEKLGWAREEMQRDFQQFMNARTMRVCAVCSERWDTAEDGGADYRWVVCCRLKPPPMDKNKKETNKRKNKKKNYN